MKVYQGWRDKGDKVHVVVDDGHSQRSLCHFERNSATGFEFGYRKFATDDLARSILRDFLGTVPNTEIAQEFKRWFLESLDHLQPWAITGAEVAAWLIIVEAQDCLDPS